MDSSSVQPTMASPNEEQSTARLLQLVKSLPVELQTQIADDTMPQTINIVIDTRRYSQKMRCTEALEIEVVRALIETLPELASSITKPSNIKLPATTHKICIRFEELTKVEKIKTNIDFALARYARVDIAIPFGCSVRGQHCKIVDLDCTFDRTSFGGWKFRTAMLPARPPHDDPFGLPVMVNFTKAFGSPFVNNVDTWAFWMLRDHVEWLLREGDVYQAYTAFHGAGCKLLTLEVAARFRDVDLKLEKDMASLKEGLKRLNGLLDEIRFG
ncbi:unnamed protein product [Zymoseptoria tritici ST99CH_1A5]|uniref:Uncharacterized protein n=1 Tax=Zymoseptoria tritici ST99CH_1A5 TaxID=1276529 RepID=A0A1Y6LQ50_ZYMTR|nr:unnamed protein product [Zymoseptoria tritici ST99CH_1A5]